MSLIAQSPISNHWNPKRMPPKVAVERHMIYVPAKDWTYSHHPALAYFKGRYFAIWSNGHKDEDAPGQRVLLSTSTDFATWTTPRTLFVPYPGANGEPVVLTAAGFRLNGDQLVAYAGSYEHGFRNTTLLAETTTDGDNWSLIQNLRVPICPNQGPEALQSGRLIIAGNTTFPFSDDPTGLGGWTESGLNPPDSQQKTDDPGSFWHVQKEAGWKGALCEGSFFQTDDGVIHMLLREAGGTAHPLLWLTESSDDGQTWSAPTLTHFSNDNAKFHCGRLPDGRFYVLGNPKPKGGRNPLVISLSSDGVDFRTAFTLATTKYRRKRAGLWKEGQYGYPHSIVVGDSLCMIVSRQKEAVEVLRVPLSLLGQRSTGN
jgi:BNR repeat-like domain